MEHNFNPLLNEVFVFRPSDVPTEGVVITTSGYRHGGQGLLRYAKGKWIPDDGKPDLALLKVCLPMGLEYHTPATFFGHGETLI